MRRLAGSIAKQSRSVRTSIAPPLRLTSKGTPAARSTPDVILDAVKVYTRGGDRGETSLFGGQRVRKDELRVEAYGAVDELNAILGVAAAELEDRELLGLIETVQSTLFDLGGELATPNVDEREAGGKGIPRVAQPQVEELEAWIDKLDEELEPLRNFVLPGGTRAAALLHYGRTVCRRAERRVVALAAGESIASVLVRYLNRLSDLLFTLARAVNRRAGVDETLWSGRSG
jgi:cob(I)alamin adenosyltransferase